MKKICLLCLVLVLIATCMLSCGTKNEAQSEATISSTTQTTSTNSSHTAADLAPPYIMIDGTLYWVNTQQYSFPVEEEDIIGYVTSKIPMNRAPAENGQANCLEVGTAYALYDHEEYGLIYVAQSGDDWVILTPKGPGDFSN